MEHFSYKCFFVSCYFICMPKVMDMVLDICDYVFSIERDSCALMLVASNGVFTKGKGECGSSKV